MRARDTRLGRQVALKVLRDPERGSLFRFKREFRAIADLRHPNLVRLHDLGAHVRRHLRPLAAQRHVAGGEAERAERCVVYGGGERVSDWIAEQREALRRALRGQ